MGEADTQLSRDVSPGTDYMIWQCVNCSRWHMQIWSVDEPVCLRCGKDSREWMAALNRTDHGEFVLDETLLHKLIRQANKFEKEALYDDT